MKTIQITTQPDENFTPAGLMNRYAKHTVGAQFIYGYFGQARLLMSGRVYQYHHWSITEKDGQNVVSLYLEEVPA